VTSNPVSGTRTSDQSACATYVHIQLLGIPGKLAWLNNFDHGSRVTTCGGFHVLTG